MEVINIQNVWRRWRLSLLRALPQYEPFLELSGRRRTEIALGRGGYSLFRDSPATEPLAKLAIVDGRANPAEACAPLHRDEEVVVSIDLEHCYLRQKSLPKSAAGKVGPILDLDMAHLTPFAPGSVLSGWINHGASGADPNLKIDHVVIRKDIVADIVDAIRGCGAKPIGIFVRDGAGPALPLAMAIDGRPFKENAKKLWTRIATAGLALLVFSAGAFAGVVLVRQSHMLAVIEAENSAVEKDAIKVRSRLDEIKAKSAEISGLQARKLAAAERLEIIEEMSRILPDEAYLDGISIESSHVAADGSAANPERLISILESSPLFHNVAFSSPVFRNPGEEKSHFSIKLDLEIPATEVPK